MISLGTIFAQAYLSVAPYIATFVDYRTPLIEHILMTKLRHWERALRELASRALGALVCVDMCYFVSSCIPRLLNMCIESALEVSPSPEAPTMSLNLQQSSG